MEFGDLLRAAESGGDQNASNPNSSALGPDQFIASTWLNTIKAARPDLAEGQSDQALLDLRRDPQLSGEMRDYYANQNQAILSKAGVPVTPGTTYLAHFAGPSGAVKILQADPGASVSDILGPGVVKANPFLDGMTAQGLQAWAAKKMGATSPLPQSPSASQPSPATAIPQSAPPPIFAAPQQQPQPTQQAEPQSLQVPDIHAPPIFYAPRKPINLSALKSAFMPPVFPRS